jgi:inward rectifier potassium channel
MAHYHAVVAFYRYCDSVFTVLNVGFALAYIALGLDDLPGVAAPHG